MRRVRRPLQEEAALGHAAGAVPEADRGGRADVQPALAADQLSPLARQPHADDRAARLLVAELPLPDLHELAPAALRPYALDHAQVEPPAAAAPRLAAHVHARDRVRPQLYEPPRDD